MQDPILSPNPQLELAKQRNRAAAERTLMAWIRTSLTLISFGFGIDQIILVLSKTAGHEFNPMGLSRIFGLSFIALGIFAMLAAALEHRHELRQIRRDPYVYTSSRSLGLIVASVLIFIGIAAFIAILVNLRL